MVRRLASVVWRALWWTFDLLAGTRKKFEIFVWVAMVVGSLAASWVMSFLDNWLLGAVLVFSVGIFGFFGAIGVFLEDIHVATVAKIKEEPTKIVFL